MITPLTIPSALRASAARTPEKTAIREEARSITFAQMCERMDQVSARGVSDLALKPQDRVMLVAYNCLEYIEIFAGMAQIGVMTATLTPRLTSRELQSIAIDCNAKAIFADASCAGLVAEIGLPVILIGPDGDYDAWRDQAPKGQVFPETASDLPVVIPYTSGSTGMPKGVVLSTQSRLKLVQGSAEVYGCFGPDDEYLAVSPLCYGGGLLYAIAILIGGGGCTMERHFDAERTMDQMAGGFITGVFLVPTHFHQMLSLPEDVVARNRTRGALRTIISNAAPLTDALRLRILDYWGEGLLHETYGATEAGVVCNLWPADQRRKKKCVGLPIPGIRLRIVDSDGDDVPVGEIGELFIHSDYRFNGYLNRPAETAEVLKGEWIAIGDLARQDEEGYYYIVGRSKDMILSGGINIYPKEIEDALTGHPAVAEAAVAGFEDAQWGESVGAAVVLHAGQNPAQGELQAHVRQVLASYKSPRRLMLISELPRNAMGKIDKAAVRTLLAKVQ